MEQTSSTRPDGVPIDRHQVALGCLGECDSLAFADGAPGGPIARALWHEAFVETLAGPALGPMVWLLEELAMAIDGEAAGIRPLEVRLFVAEHNWPDPGLAQRFASALEFVASRPAVEGDLRRVVS